MNNCRLVWLAEYDVPGNVFPPPLLVAPVNRVIGSTGANGELRRFQDPVQEDAIHQQVRLYHQQEGCGEDLVLRCPQQVLPSWSLALPQEVFNIKTKTGKEADGFSLHWGQPRFTIERDSGQNNLHKV